MALIKNTQKICPECGTPIVTVIRKGKRPFSMCIDTKCKTKESWEKKSYNVNNSDGTVTEAKNKIVAQPDATTGAQEASGKKPEAVAKETPTTKSMQPKATKRPAAKKPTAKTPKPKAK